nr:helicase-related protein [Bacillota bacterium]
EKGQSPDILVMTATPIPRTLAVVIFGELDVSVIDEKPAGRRDIITKSTDISKRTLVYDFVRKEVEKGRQAYVVAPLIEESESIEARSAEEIYEELKKLMPDKIIALIHGAKKQKEKDAVMEDFVRGITDILVSTVVIEVGIDVSNASVMVIENAERFGLAQLHQLRGRVGRGESQSYCILINGINVDQKGSPDESVASKRAAILTESADGFYIAEKDLELRGPGEFFGTRQHGIPDLHVADLVKHMNIFEEIKEQAEGILDKDPQLAKAPALREKVDDLFGEGMNL